MLIKSMSYCNLDKVMLMESLVYMYETCHPNSNRIWNSLLRDDIAIKTVW